MDGSYDENLSENPFYAEFKNEYGNLFQHCISQSWIICVPRVGCSSSRVYTVEDFCAHILVPSDELPETHYNTLTEKQVTVVNKVITVEVTKGLPLQSHILFEETFYTEDFMKYKVWCIETPLEPSTATGSSIATDYISSINDCIDLLWTQAAGRQVLDQIEHSVKEFLKKNPSLPQSVGLLRDAVSELYTQCLQIALQNRRLREKSKSCKQVLDNIKIAVECYMQHLLFNYIFKPLCTCCAYEDSHLNKKIRNLSDIQLRDLDIRKDLYQTIPRARQILSKLNSYTTVLEKVLCLKQALNAINKVEKGENIILLTADDMLPVFVFLVIKSNLPNWFTQVTYMKEFRFSGTTKGDGDECAFLITTLEAVVQHIQSGALAGPPNPEAYYYESDLIEENLNGNQKRKNSLTESLSTSDTNSGEETLEYIFELIKASHTEQVRTILERNHKHLNGIEQGGDKMLKLALEGLELFDDDDSDEEAQPKLCHPLCNCKRCCKKISKNLIKTSPTVTSRDNHCLTPLHVASIHGKAAIVETLIDIGAEIDASDLNECTPLHYAASRGHQNALLLLVHSGANINRVNIDKNTPLHMAVNNGHLNCVKALIYFAEHSRKDLKINCANDSGNTPLHLASKWGYEGIAELLIKNGAEPSIQNRYNKTPFDYAHNLNILHILKSCTPNLYEYIHITSSNIKALNCKSDNQVAAKLQAATNKTHDVQNASKTVENLKRIERILKAISYGDVKLACFYMNINYVAYVSGSNEANGSPCHPLCECSSCRQKSESSISDFDVNFCDSNGVTALQFASRYGLEELCRILILNKADVNLADKTGQTAVHLSSINNKTIVLRLLLDNGGNVNAIDMSGNTPLHEASQMGNIGAVKILLAYNPDTSIINTSGKSALDIAKEKVHLTIIDLIEKYSHHGNKEF